MKLPRSIVRWYGLVGGEVIGPFETMDRWYHDHAGPDWRHREAMRTGIDPWTVAREDAPDGHDVSTVFLGLDHSYNPSGPPILFETMIFPEAEVFGRCSTLEQAKAMHAAAINHYQPASPGSYSP